MNEKMIAFIICANDETYLEECIYYIEHLRVPQDFMIDIIAITEAEYMTGAYNAAMRESDARYKVYLHQDVFILNRNFIADMLEIFADKQVGMIGMIGCDKYPKDGGFASAWNVGKAYVCSTLKTYVLSYVTARGNNREVAAIDGMLMATQYDIEWNENLKGWHFYDVSQSIEFTEKGYKIVVPYQETPWTLHDEGQPNMSENDGNENPFLVKFLLRRIEYGFEFSEYREIVSWITDGKISASYLSSVIEHSVYYQQRVWEELYIRCEKNKQWTYENLIFDQFQRYHTLAEIVRRIKSNIGIEECRILEVGANVQKNLGKELFEDNVYYTDLKIPEEFTGDNRCFQADATNLWQVQDNRFDVAVASDVFEHIPVEGRHSFLTELHRVVKEAVVICFPRKSRAVEMAELQVNEHYKALTGIDHRWLKEHIDNGLPECSEIDAFLRENDIEFVSFTHGELEMWKKMLEACNIAAACPHSRDYKRLIDQYYNKYIYRCDSGEEDYRVFYILLKNHNIDVNIFDGLIGKEKDLSKVREIDNMCNELLRISISHRNVQADLIK